MSQSRTRMFVGAYDQCHDLWWDKISEVWLYTVSWRADIVCVPCVLQGIVVLVCVNMTTTGIHHTPVRPLFCSNACKQPTIMELHCTTHKTKTHRWRPILQSPDLITPVWDLSAHKVIQALQSYQRSNGLLCKLHLQNNVPPQTPLWPSSIHLSCTNNHLLYMCCYRKVISIWTVLLWWT